MTRPINEPDEFLLSRLLDDDLSPEEATGLRARMEREPELRRAYAAMTRIDSLLIARRADQPQVDWARFHSQVMSQVEAAAARPITIKLASYLRAVLPLAAAAAIALVIWYWPHGGTPLGTPAGLKPNTEVAKVEEIVIHVGQPSSTGGDDTIHVAFARSDDLTSKYRTEDETSRKQEGFAVLASTEAPRADTSSPGLLAVASALIN